MKRLWFPLFALTALLTLAACSGAKSAVQSDEYIMGEAAGLPMEAPAAPMMKEYAVDSVSNRGGGESVEATSVERMVLKNAQVSIVVADVEARMKEIQMMAEQLGGFVVSSNLYEAYASDNTYVPEAQVTVRVPAEQLDAALEKIKQDAVEVKSENKSGEDVTAQYVDLQSRLKNLEAAEAQLEEIMRDATATEDVVNVFNQLTYYREQIEMVKGQMKYYEESAALSSISVQIIAEEKEKPIVIGGWKPGGVAKEAIQDLIYFYQDFVDFVIRFVIFILPVLVTVAIPLYLLFLGGRALFRLIFKPKKKETPHAPAAQEAKK